MPRRVDIGRRADGSRVAAGHGRSLEADRIVGTGGVGLGHRNLRTLEANSRSHATGHGHDEPHTSTLRWHEQGGRASPGGDDARPPPHYPAVDSPPRPSRPLPRTHRGTTRIGSESPVPTTTTRVVTSEHAQTTKKSAHQRVFPRVCVSPCFDMKSLREKRCSCPVEGQPDQRRSSANPPHEPGTHPRDRRRRGGAPTVPKAWGPSPHLRYPDQTEGGRHLGCVSSRTPARQPRQITRSNDCLRAVLRRRRPGQNPGRRRRLRRRPGG